MASADKLAASIGTIREFSPNERSFLGLVYEPAVDRPWADQARLQLGWQRIIDDRETRDFGSPLLFTEQNRSDLYSASLVLAKRWSGAYRTRYGMDLTSDTVHSARQVGVVDPDVATRPQLLAVHARREEGRGVVVRARIPR